MEKAYKFRLYPNKEQAILFGENFWLLPVRVQRRVGGQKGALQGHRRNHQQI